MFETMKNGLADGRKEESNSCGGGAEPVKTPGETGVSVPDEQLDAISGGVSIRESVTEHYHSHGLSEDEAKAMAAKALKGMF